MLYGRLDGGSDVVDHGGPAASPTPTATVPTATVPTAPSAPPPPPTVSFGGYDPNYKDLITNDPAYIAAQSAATATEGAARAQRQARLRQLYVMYGGSLPEGFSDQYGDIDQATKDAAAANENSTVARLRTNYEQGRDQFMKQLAARGALQSGELNYGQDQLQRGYEQQQYDAANQFLSGANDVYGNYLGAVTGVASNLSSAIGQAESNVYSNPAYRPVAATTANYDPAYSAQYGQPLYTDGNGNYYTADGNPFTPPAAAASPVPSAPAAGGHTAAWYAYHIPDWNN